MAVIEQMSLRDRMELLSLTDGNPQKLLRETLAGSTYSFAGVEASGAVIVVGGAINGRVWMIASEAGLERHKRQFLRQSKAEVAEMLKLWPVLRTRVDERWIKSLRWLRWLGFRECGTGEFAGRRFRQMEIAAERSAEAA